jgi:hypothetical protein
MFSMAILSICWIHFTNRELRTGSYREYRYIMLVGIGSNFQILVASEYTRRQGPAVVNIYSLVDRYSAGGANVRSTVKPGLGRGPGRRSDD